MNAATSPKLDVGAGPVTSKVRRRIRVMFVGCACLLGAGLLALERWSGGPALSPEAAVQAKSGGPSHGAGRGASPTEYPLQPRTSSSAAASRTPPFRQNLTAQLDAIRAEPDESAQEERLEQLAARIATADLARALTFLAGLEASELTQSLGIQLLRRWTAENPLAAATWVSLHASGANRQEEIRTVAITWADQSLPEALAWARQLPQSAERNAGLVAIAYEATRSAPLEAFRVVEELPDGQVRNELIRHTANQWADLAPHEAVAWASKVEDEVLRLQLLAGITTAWGDKEPAAAASAAAGLLPPGRPQDDAIIGIVQRWVQTEPALAAHWVMDFPTGPLQNTALEAVAKLWADQEPARTGAWINQLK